MFLEILKKIVRHVDGVEGCMLLDADAVPIAELYPGEEDGCFGNVAVEMTNLLRKLERQSESENMGQITEFSLTTKRFATIGHIVGDDFVLLVALNADADFTRGRDMLRLMSPWIEQIL